MLRTLFWTFFRIAAVTPGGGLVMLPIIQQEFETRRKWISTEEMVDIIAMVQSTPGIIAVNMAIMLGYRVAGFPGALAASFGAVLPSWILILLIAALFHSLSASPLIDHAFAGIRAAVCALILLSTISMGRKILRGTLEILIASLAFVALFVFGLNAIWVILAGCLLGLLFRRPQP